MESLQRETPRDQNLTGLRFATESRGEIRHAADRPIVPASLEADGTDRCIALPEADPELEFEPGTPSCN
jgi:hypothetical protein